MEQKDVKTFKDVIQWARANDKITKITKRDALYEIHWDKLVPEAQFYGYLADHVPDYGDVWVNPKVEVHVIRDVCFDGNRGWRLSFVTYCNTIVFMAAEAGRGNKDYCEKVVFNKKKYFELVEYLHSLTVDHNQDPEEINIESDCKDFISFYGFDLFATQHELYGERVLV